MPDLDLGFTDHEKERIRLEEALRYEIRVRLAESKDVFTPGWAFLNSTFGVWLLSALFITGAGGAFTYWQQWNAERMKKEDTISKLDLEICYRFSQVIGRLHELTDGASPRAKLQKPYTEADIKATLNILQETSSKSIATLYPEYATFGLPSLLAELRRHMDDGKQREEVDQSLSQLTNKRIAQDKPVEVNDKAGRIIEELMLSRWRNGPFAYADCSGQAPFC
ncbi:MAG: hypothetical protein SFV18_09635 [Bryobacteraceae bacterium]|nr:hypothetical protein [Bryobacteraceae bacterium]